MYLICIDENGFYKEGNNGNLVEVKDIPICVDLKTYKYNEENKILEPNTENN